MHDGVQHHRHCPRASPQSQPGTNDAAAITSSPDITTASYPPPLIPIENSITPHASSLHQAFTPYYHQHQHSHSFSPPILSRALPAVTSSVTAFSEHHQTPLFPSLNPSSSYTHSIPWSSREASAPVMENSNDSSQRTLFGGSLYYEWPQDASDELSAVPQESPQQYSFINPQQIHNDIRRNTMGEEQLFTHDTDLIFPQSTMSSPYIQAAATPQSNCDSPASFHSGNADAMSADDAETDVSEPYNVLLHRCLMEAPYQERMLREIYDWFIRNTDKGGKDKSKGWQNSIRHNLSMNPAFEKGSRSQQNPNVANMWSLSEDAIEHGVQPTTRFRNTTNRLAGRSRLRAHTTTGAVRKARSTSRMRPYNLRDTAPRSSPGLARSTTDLFSQNDERQDQTMVDSIRALNGDSGLTDVSSNETVGPYFATQPETVRPLQEYSLTSSASYNNGFFEDSMSRSFGQLQTPVPTTEAQEQTTFSQCFNGGPSYGTYPSFNYNSGTTSTPPGRPRFSPPLSTPSLEEAPLSGMWDDSGDGPLFMSDDEFDQRALKTPPPPNDVKRVTSAPDHKISNGSSRFFFSGSR